MIELNKQNVKKILLIITFVLVGLWAVDNMKSVLDGVSFIFKLLGPFILGFAIAFVLNVPLKFFEKVFAKKISKTRVNTKRNREKDRKYKRNLRIVSIILSMLIFVLVVFLIVFLVLPELINTFEIFKQNVPVLFNNIQDTAEDLMVNYPNVVQKIKDIRPDWQSIETTINDFLKDGFANVLSSSVNFIVSAVSSVVSFVMAVIFAIYMLYQKEKLSEQVLKVIYAYLPKKKADNLLKIGKISNTTFSKFIGGQLMEACILGLLCFIGMTILGIPYALTSSVLVGFTALIPVFGAFIGTAIAAILIVVVAPVKALWFVIFIIILQQIEGNVIYPKVVGSSVGLPAMWVMLAVIVDGSCFGMVGMLLSVPVSSILYTLFKESVNTRLAAKKWKWEE